MLLGVRDGRNGRLFLPSPSPMAPKALYQVAKGPPICPKVAISAFSFYSFSPLSFPFGVEMHLPPTAIPGSECCLIFGFPLKTLDFSVSFPPQFFCEFFHPSPSSSIHLPNQTVARRISKHFPCLPILSDSSDRFFFYASVVLHFFFLFYPPLQ